MEGSILMECYEDVFEEITSKLYSDEPITKSPGSFLKFGSRLRSSGLTMPPQCLVNNSNNQISENNNNEAIWFESDESLSWSMSKVARYNVISKMYKCVDCGHVGFLSRIAAHWLGTHADLKAFRCPRCPYSSAWAKGVRMHLTRNHNEQHTDAALWKDNAAIEEVTRLLHNLRSSAENRGNTNGSNISNSSDGDSLVSTNHGVEGLTDKRYACPQCPYATDRRDLYTRHENIHKDEKPFHCYVCYKMFSRADHVKKHFFRMHKEVPYDIHLIRRLPVKNSNNSTTIGNGNSDNSGFHLLCNSISRDSANGTHSSTNNCRIRTSTNFESKYVMNSKKRHLPKMFSCTYCSWRGVDNWCLKRHLNTHIKPYLCVLCDYKAARAERLSTHVLKIHNKRICNKCSFLAEDQVQLNSHARDAHHERHLIKCEDCAETFEGTSELESHGIMVHNKDLLDCNHCDYKTTHRNNLEHHHHERHSSELQNLPNVKNEIRCRECGCGFANQTSLQTHLLLLHRSQRVSNSRSSCPYLCSLCEYGSSTQMNMMEHMRIHTGEVLRCLAEDCNFKTPFNSVLREHVEFIHDDDNFIIRCPHCGFSLNSRQTLAHHFPLHHSRLCTLCTAVIRKHFPHKNRSGNFLIGNDNDCFLVDGQAQVNLTIVTEVKRSRKQSKPRKITQTDEDDDDFEITSSPKLKRRKSVAEFSSQLLTTSPSSTTASLASSKCFRFQPQFRCRQCRPCVSFNQKKNWLLHVRWNHMKRRFSCEHCARMYMHQYQVLLHASRDHVIQRL